MRDADAVELVAKSAGRARVVVRGTSMRPLLRAGMVLGVEPLARPPRIGDILVFRSRAGLAAHRCIARERVADGVIFVTAGDATPHRTERVPPHLVVGRVATVRANASPDARRLDGVLATSLGWLYARTRRRRASLAAARRYASLALADPQRIAPPRAFAALVAATRHFEAGRFAEGVATLASVPESNTIATVRAHHASGMVAAWLDDAVRAGARVPPTLHDALRRTRWNNALQAGRVLRTVADVRDRFVAAEIPHVFLKGGARLAAGEPAADLHFSCDVDVIVPSEAISRALGALRTAGYRDVFDEKRRVRYESHHHRSPLHVPGRGVPVEIHVALVREDLVSAKLDYGTLASHASVALGPVGSVVVLDDVAAALHLAYHARDLHVWRDVIFLSRMLAALAPRRRARFDACVAAERRDATRLSSVVLAADRIANDVALEGASRYLDWAVAREDLPRGVPTNDVLEAIASRCHVEALRLRDTAEIPALVWRLVKNIAFMPTVVRLCRTLPADR